MNFDKKIPRKMYKRAKKHSLFSLAINNSYKQSLIKPNMDLNQIIRNLLNVKTCINFIVNHHLYQDQAEAINKYF